jgi:hypothetical protein
MGAPMNEELREMRDEMRENHKEVNGRLVALQTELNLLALKIAIQEQELKRLDKLASDVTGGLSRVFWIIASVIIGAAVMWVLGGGLDGKG